MMNQSKPAKSIKSKLQKKTTATVVSLYSSGKFTGIGSCNQKTRRKDLNVTDQIMIDYLGFAYAAVVAVGGVMGYIKAGSVMSLGAGVTFGSLAALGAYQMSADPARYQSLLVVSCILAALMGYRYTNSGKFMPAGLVASLSIATAVRIILTKVLFVGGLNH
ncbi:transmembrane protein 14C-like [Varroa destructor]|uniref:Transmembrane protein 14C n=1 Tax=Varroa destructor TaxID=109461 RepID=A0A7M7J1A4_VARDE|nr:transmembrane protein 14C-like [Varroa destructor]